MIVDALGLPTAFEITEGQRHDNQRAPPRRLLGDKGYDSNTIRTRSAA